MKKDSHADMSQIPLNLVHLVVGLLRERRVCFQIRFCFNSP